MDEPFEGYRDVRATASIADNTIELSLKTADLGVSQPFGISAAVLSVSNGRIVWGDRADSVSRRDDSPVGLREAAATTADEDLESSTRPGDSEYAYRWVDNYDVYVDENTLDEVPFEDIQYGEYVVVNDPAVSKYAFIYYVPDNIADFEKVRILLAGHSRPDHDYDSLVAAIASDSMARFEWATEEYGYAVLLVAVPQIAQYFGESAMIEGEIENPFWERPDLEYIAVINAFADKLEVQGLDVHRKVFVTGGSNGGLQAHVFSVMHPGIVEAAAPIAAGRYVYLQQEMYGHEMPFPAGLSGTSRIAAWEFSPDEFKKVEQLYLAGSEDTHPRNQVTHPVDNDLFGSNHPERVVMYVDYLKNYGVERVEAKIYEGVGHRGVWDMTTDTIEFFNSIPLSQ